MNNRDIRLLIPVFLLQKLKVHPLTRGLYPVALGKTSLENNFQITQNSAPFFSLIYCHGSGGNLQMENIIKQLNIGDLAIIPPMVPYRFTAEKQENVKTMSANDGIFWLNFEGDLAPNFAERFFMKMDDGISYVGFFKNVEKDLDELLALGQRGYTATNVIHAVHVLQQTLSFLALQLRVSDFNASSKFNLKAVEQLMQDNLHQELSLDALAHYSQLSKFHFAKKFKELTDSSPIQHFINMKIQKACLDLDNGNLPIKNIAENVGYNDPYYFSRLFKKVVGMSPKQYRDSRHAQ